MMDRLSILKSCCASSHSFSLAQRVVVKFSLAFAILLFPSLRLMAQGSLRYAVVDLPDGASGDLWEYSYTFSGFNFQLNQGFSIYFDSQLYRDLQNPRPVGSPDWSMIAVQPDVFLNAPGYLDGQALVNGPVFQGPFQVAFVWLGVGAPGAQSFDIYDSNFQILFSGSSVVPEPQSLLLTVVGGLILSVSGALRSRNRS